MIMILILALSSHQKGKERERTHGGKPERDGVLVPEAQQRQRASLLVEGVNHGLSPQRTQGEGGTLSVAACAVRRRLLCFWRAVLIRRQLGALGYDRLGRGRRWWWWWCWRWGRGGRRGHSCAAGGGRRLEGRGYIAGAASRGHCAGPQGPRAASAACVHVRRPEKGER